MTQTATVNNSIGTMERPPAFHHFRVQKAQRKMNVAIKAYMHAAWGLSHAASTENRYAWELAIANRNEASNEHMAAIDAYDLAVSKSYFEQRALAQYKLYLTQRGSDIFIPLEAK